HQHHTRLFWQGLAWPTLWQLGLGIFTIGKARVSKGAGMACRPAARTDGGAQIHLALNVSAHVQCVVGQLIGTLRQIPQYRFGRATRRVSVNTDIPREHALDVAIHDGAALTPCEGCNGSGGGTSD